MSILARAVDPVTGLLCREDGAVFIPQTDGHPAHWTFGCDDGRGYRVIGYKGKRHSVHRLVCRAFHGLPPEDKPFCDHKNRIKSANFASNLHWVSCKENNDNADRVDKSIEKYGARACEDKKAYDRSYGAARITKKKAQGLRYCKGPDGKFGWYPKINTTKKEG